MTSFLEKLLSMFEARLLFKHTGFIIEVSAFHPLKRMVSAHERKAGESYLEAEIFFFNAKYQVLDSNLNTASD
jgi:hypothetical protein